MLKGSGNNSQRYVDPPRARQIYVACNIGKSKAIDSRFENLNLSHVGLGAECDLNRTFSQVQNTPAKSKKCVHRYFQ
jgi:hypothetical protein